ncbi:hypothetical protein GWK47_036994 [Chionoecetes opilio]|uniref:Uncharacterized protein n=1 Tax=Chionoecetes opilio TaxID=41210 RepID=A0A8J5CYU8_CHIOP|nr:hypothetical protein GWK47_036994 [Chionoecetes opilio]
MRGDTRLPGRQTLGVWVMPPRAAANARHATRSLCCSDQGDMTSVPEQDQRCQVVILVVRVFPQDQCCVGDARRYRLILWFRDFACDWVCREPGVVVWDKLCGFPLMTAGRGVLRASCGGAVVFTLLCVEYDSYSVHCNMRSPVCPMNASSSREILVLAKVTSHWIVFCSWLDKCLGLLPRRTMSRAISMTGASLLDQEQLFRPPTSGLHVNLQNGRPLIKRLRL